MNLLFPEEQQMKKSHRNFSVKEDQDFKIIARLFFKVMNRKLCCFLLSICYRDLGSTGNAFLNKVIILLEQGDSMYRAFAQKENNVIGYHHSNADFLSKSYNLVHIPPTPLIPSLPSLPFSLNTLSQH